MKFFTVIVLSLSIVFPKNALTNYEDAINSLIRQGNNFSYNFNPKSAEQVYDKIIENYPNDPRGYYFKSELYLWFYLGNNNDEDLDKFNTLSGIAIDKAKVLQKNEKMLEMALLFEGNAYTLRAIAHGKAQNYLEMIWASKNSHSSLTEVLEINKDNVDARTGLGLFKFAMSQVPSSFQWALNMVGLKGSIREGITLLKMAATKGNYTKVPAQYFLAQILTEYLHDYNSADDWIEGLTKSYPNNLLFQYSDGIIKMKKRNLNQAEPIFQRIIKSDNQKFSQISAFSHFILGDIQFFKGNYNSAKEYYIKFLSKTREKNYSGIGYFRLALCYEFLDDREMAKVYYPSATKGNLSLDDDFFAAKYSEIYLKKEITPLEKRIIKLKNLLESGSYNAVLDSVEKLSSEIVNDDRKKAELYVYASEAALALKKYPESLNFAKRAINNASRNTWIEPYANYFAAYSALSMKNGDEGIIFLEKAESFSDFEYSNRLKSLCSALRYRYQILD